MVPERKSWSDHIRDLPLPIPDTPSNGFREYPEDTVQRILFIRRGKELGFTLQEISELLNLRYRPKENCDAVRQVTIAKIEDINQSIKSLKQIRTQLQRLAPPSSASCPSTPR